MQEHASVLDARRQNKFYPNHHFKPQDRHDKHWETMYCIIPEPLVESLDFTHKELIDGSRHHVEDSNPSDFDDDSDGTGHPSQAPLKHSKNGGQDDNDDYEQDEDPIIVETEGGGLRYPDNNPGPAPSSSTSEECQPIASSSRSKRPISQPSSPQVIKKKPRTIPHHISTARPLRMQILPADPDQRTLVPAAAEPHQGSSLAGDSSLTAEKPLKLPKARPLPKQKGAAGIFPYLYFSQFLLMLSPVNKHLPPSPLRLLLVNLIRTSPWKILHLRLTLTLVKVDHTLSCQLCWPV